MKVFISWSGDRSKTVAEALREWIPKVLQAVKPWLSSRDIPKGGRWRQHIAAQLEDAKVGIICLTPENLSAEWILFEGGAIAKTLEETFVCTYLLGIKPSDVRDPLAQFQAARADKPDSRMLMQTINNALGKDALSEKQFDATFEKWWPDLEVALGKIPSAPSGQRETRPLQDMLEEILDSVRALRKTISDYPIPGRGGLSWDLGQGRTPPQSLRELLYMMNPNLVSYLEQHTSMEQLASQLEKLQKEEEAKGRSKGSRKFSKD